MHRKGHIRERFTDWLDEHGADVPPDTPEARELLGSVWHCTDVLPGVYCDQLDIARGSTYARAAQDLPAWYEHRQPLST